MEGERGGGGGGEGGGGRSEMRGVDRSLLRGRDIRRIREIKREGSRKGERVGRGNLGCERG